MGAMMPMQTLARTTPMHSIRYGRYRQTSTISRKNHAPHTHVLEAPMRLTIGLARRTSVSHGTPAQNNIAKRIPTNTIELPRSPAARISTIGTPTTTAGRHNSTSNFGGSRTLASTRASISTTVIFASSDGWPMRCPPIVSQLLELAASPAPLPSTKSDASTTSVPRYAGHAAHSRNRTDARLIANAPTSDTPSQMICDLYSRATTVGTSVWPAE